MPPWFPIVIAILQDLPAIIAVIEKILAEVQTANQPLTVSQVNQLAAYASMVNGMNKVLQFHINP